MNELALFAGAGGGILGGMLCGFRTVCAVEIEPYAIGVLMQRQNDGILPAFPIWDDVCTFDGRPWRGIVDVVSGGFPCQDISVAGAGAGITGERSGLWKEMARIIGEVGPSHVIVENSPALTSRGLGTVLGDLATLGYDAQWGVLGAHHAGAPHKRDRIWIVADSGCGRRRQQEGRQVEQSWGAKAERPSNYVANANCLRELQPQGVVSDIWRRSGHCGQNVANASGERLQGGQQSAACDYERHREKAHGSTTERRCSWWDEDPANIPDAMRSGLSKNRAQQQPAGFARDSSCPGPWPTEPVLGRVAHGVAHRVDRLKALGNGQVPAVVRLAWEALR